MPKAKILQFPDKAGIKLNIGCGTSKEEGWVGIDYRALPGVDVVWDIEQTPWPLESESVIAATSHHVLEHLNPHGGDKRLQPLIDLLVSKKVLGKQEAETLGAPGPAFMNVMDEIWRVLKPHAQFHFVVPYAGSPGFWQDPTHINGITENTLRYFDPLDESGLYQFYEPAPWEWQKEISSYTAEGNMEAVLRKRLDDRSYHADNKVHYE